MRGMTGKAAAIGVLVMALMGCAGTMNAIENRQLSLQAKMSDTIFLNPDILAANKKVYVRATNTSDFQEINFGEAIKKKLEEKGYTVTSDSKNAAYVVQANLLYLGEEKEGLTADGMVMGGFGGAIAGASMGDDVRQSLAGGLGGAVVGSIVGGLVGSMVHVDTYLGATDVQIKELAAGEVKGTTLSRVTQGSNATIETQQSTVAKHQEYRTRIAVQARQTNINREEATNLIAERLAAQIAGMF